MLQSLELVLKQGAGSAALIPTSEQILSLFYKYKDYTYLPSFIGFITNTEESCAITANIVCTELEKGNNNSAGRLHKLFTKQQRGFEDAFSLELGRRRLKTSLPHSIDFYYRGLIKVDAADLIHRNFLSAKLMLHMAECGAVKCMDLVSINVFFYPIYLDGACNTRNTKTLQCLLEKEDCHEAFQSYALRGNREVLWFLQNGFTLTKETLNKIQERFPELYAELEEQV